MGGVALAAYVSIAVLSYLHAPALWQGAYYPKAAAFFSGLYGPENYNAIVTFFGGPLMVLLSRWLPVIVASGVAIVLIAMLRDPGARADGDVARRILHWALIFTGAAFFAYPVYTQDFWLSALWGDMTASGVNPYHVIFTKDMIGPLPLDHFPMPMSYGPLWALISALIMSVSGGSVLVAGLLFKLILAAAWCATLILVDRLAAKIAPGQRALALVVAGWLPLGVLQTVAEGHNDVFLVMPVLLWLALLLGGRNRAPVALTASVLCKFATAPLFLADMLHALRQRRMTLPAYCIRMAVPAILFLGLLALFYRSLAFFDGLRLIKTWHFMHPDDAFLVFASLFGEWIAPAGKLLLLVFPAVAAWQCRLYWESPGNERLIKLVLAIMCAVSFAMVSHLWPWYVVWTLPLAALIPQWWLSRFIIGIALAMPFAFAVWWVPEAEPFGNHVALVIYASAALWTYLTSPEAARAVRRAPAGARVMAFDRSGAEAALPLPRMRTLHDAAGIEAPIRKAG